MNAEYPCTRVAPAARRSRTSAAVSTPPTQITQHEAGGWGWREAPAPGGCPGGERGPGDPPGSQLCYLGGRGLQTLSGKGRVRRNDAVKSQLHNKLADPHDLVIGHIRGNFHEQWCGADNVPDASQKRRERIEFL